jgi:hypothetical protein
MTKKFTQSLNLEWFPLGTAIVEVSGFYTPATPGKVSGPPESCHPGESAELEITSFLLVADADAEPLKPAIDLSPWLTPKAIEDVEWMLLEKFEEDTDYSEEL